MSYDDLAARAKAWVDHDPDEATRAELTGLLARGEEAVAELAARFSGPLAFGTAGLRGILGAGESRMNRAVVLRTAHGLGAWLSVASSSSLRAASMSRRRPVAWIFPLTMIVILSATLSTSLRM